MSDLASQKFRRCQECANCVLKKTGGICPIMQCPKGILNGPCGAMWEGMCEVLGDQSCVHISIARILQHQEQPKQPILPPRNINVKQVLKGSE